MLIILLNLANCFISSNVWAGVRLVCPDHLRGIAIGITNGVQNLGIFCSPLAIGAIMDGISDKALGFVYVCYMFAALSFSAFLVVTIWTFFDKRALAGKKR